MSAEAEATTTFKVNIEPNEAPTKNTPRYSPAWPSPFVQLINWSIACEVTSSAPQANKV